MKTIPSSWLARALRLIFAVSAAWVIYISSTHYVECRASGIHQLWCLVIAMFAGWVDILILLFEAAVRLLLAVLP